MFQRIFGRAEMPKEAGPSLDAAERDLHIQLGSLVSWPNRKPKIDNVGFEFWPLFLGVTEPEAELVAQPNKSAPAAKKPAKVRKRPAKKRPPAPAERER